MKTFIIEKTQNKGRNYESYRRQSRRLALKTVPGMETRPTTDRIKETLFNMIQDELYGIRFLDLFSGSGAIGIEALSRGAKEAVFVEKNPAAVCCIRENLKLLGWTRMLLLCSQMFLLHWIV